MQPYPTFQNYSYNPFLMNGLSQNNYAQPQMQTQPQMQAQMAGRFVNDFNEVNANDVPMDGRSAVFVKNDKSEIQVREWNPNGQIVLTSYLPQNGNLSNNMDKLSLNDEKSKFDPKMEILEPLFERLEELENKIDKISRTSRAKKEGEQA